MGSGISFSRPAPVPSAASPAAANAAAAAAARARVDHVRGLMTPIEADLRRTVTALWHELSKYTKYVNADSVRRLDADLARIMDLISFMTTSNEHGPSGVLNSPQRIKARQDYGDLLMHLTGIVTDLKHHDEHQNAQAAAAAAAAAAVAPPPPVQHAPPHAPPHAPGGGPGSRTAAQLAEMARESALEESRPPRRFVPGGNRHGPRGFGMPKRARSSDGGDIDLPAHRVKGSEAAKEHMARLRAMRVKKNP